MKNTLYRLYNTDEETYRYLVEHCQTGPAKTYYGIRMNKHGKIYLLIRSTRREVFMEKLHIFWHNLTHRKNKIRLRYKRHRRDYI